MLCTEEETMKTIGRYGEAWTYFYTPRECPWKQQCLASFLVVEFDMMINDI